MWITLVHLLSKFESSISSAHEQIGSNFLEDSRLMSMHVSHKVDENHPDYNLMTVFPVPLTIIGTKYDMFLVRKYSQFGALETQYR